MQYNTAASLLESERGVIPVVPGAAANGDAGLLIGRDLSHYRTLSPATESFSTNATLARALGKVSVSINGRVELSDSDSLQGLPLVPTLPGGSLLPPYPYFRQAGALGQQIRGTTAHIGLTLNGLLGSGWQWSFTGDGDYSNTRTSTDRGIDPAAIPSVVRLTDWAEAKSQAVTGDLLLSGPLLDLPAGAVTTSLRVGASANGFDSWSIRSGTQSNASYDREIASGQISLDLPLTSRTKGVLGAVGDIGLNVNAAAQHLSDFGTLSTLGYGVRWRPVPQVQLLMFANQDRAAPTGPQINDPLI
jgi:hypothetical protein